MSYPGAESGTRGRAESSSIDSVVRADGAGPKSRERRRAGLVVGWPEVCGRTKGVAAAVGAEAKTGAGAKSAVRRNGCGYRRAFFLPYLRLRKRSPRTARQKKRENPPEIGR